MIYTNDATKIIRKAIRTKLKEYNLKYNLISVRHDRGTAYAWIKLRYNTDDTDTIKILDKIMISFKLYYSMYNTDEYNIKKLISPDEQDYYLKEVFIPYLEEKGINYKDLIK